MQPSRDHYPGAMLVRVSGCGRETGQVIAQTTAKGVRPKEWRFDPNDLLGQYTPPPVVIDPDHADMRVDELGILFQRQAERRLGRILQATVEVLPGLLVTTGVGRRIFPDHFAPERGKQRCHRDSRRRPSGASPRIRHEAHGRQGRSGLRSGQRRKRCKIPHRS